MQHTRGYSSKKSINWISECIRRPGPCLYVADGKYRITSITCGPRNNYLFLQEDYSVWHRRYIWLKPRGHPSMGRERTKLQGRGGEQRRVRWSDLKRFYCKELYCHAQGYPLGLSQMWEEKSLHAARSCSFTLIPQGCLVHKKTPQPLGPP